MRRLMTVLDADHIDMGHLGWLPAWEHKVTIEGFHAVYLRQNVRLLVNGLFQETPTGMTVEIIITISVLAKILMCATFIFLAMMFLSSLCALVPSSTEPARPMFALIVLLLLTIFSGGYLYQTRVILPRLEAFFRKHLTSPATQDTSHD